jgi:choline-sulfatase
MSDRPNILFIVTDQQRSDALGCTGGWVQTPTLDRLAAEGVRFANCVTTAPVCVPARLNLATGRYCHNTGVWNNCGHTMPEATPTWFAALRDAGYHTALFGKTHWHPHRGDIRDREHLVHSYGFDFVDEATGPRASAQVASNMTDTWEAAGLWQAYRDDYAERFSNKRWVVRPSPLGSEHFYDTYVGQAACRYLADYDGDAPWFCYVGFPGPHEPWDTPEPWASRHAPADMPEPRSAPAGNHDRPRGRLDHMLETQSIPFEPGETQQLRADYAGNVALIDDQVRQIVEAVERRGEWDDTVVAFTSDHGEMNGDAGLIYKSNMLDPALRVPMIVRSPGTAAGAGAGAVSDAYVEWFDIGPTLVELAGRKLAHQQFARSFVPTLTDPAIPHRPEAISELDGEIMLLNDEWKVVLNDEGLPYLLFDRRNDPEESRNLAGLPESREIESALRLRILERLSESQLRLERQR